MKPSWRLRLHALGARLLVRPIFERAKDPARLAKTLDRLVIFSSRYPAQALHLNRVLGNRPGHLFSGPGSDPTRIVLYFHGGAYLAGSGDTHGAMLTSLAIHSKSTVYAQDYRLLPDTPFPCAYDDALAAWDDLLARGYPAHRIVLGGDSAGGGLMFALLATLCQRGQPPAGAFAMSPWTDLSLSGGTIASHERSDKTLPAKRIAELATAYLAGAQPTDPRASPLFADFPTPPPVMIQVGSPEILEDDTYRMADRLRATGGEVTVQTWHGAPHVWHLAQPLVPEANAALSDLGAFIQTSFADASR